MTELNLLVRGTKILMVVEGEYALCPSNIKEGNFFSPQVIPWS